MCGEREADDKDNRVGELREEEEETKKGEEEREERGRGEGARIMYT